MVLNRAKLYKLKTNLKTGAGAIFSVCSRYARPNVTINGGIDVAQLVTNT